MVGRIALREDAGSFLEDGIVDPPAFRRKLKEALVEGAEVSC